jgi:exonuclease VII small subunit
MNHLQIPLSDTEEAVLELMQKINRLENENTDLKETIKQLQWSLQEHD